MENKISVVVFYIYRSQIHMVLCRNKFKEWLNSLNIKYNLPFLLVTIIDENDEISISNETRSIG